MKRTGEVQPGEAHLKDHRNESGLSNTLAQNKSISQMADSDFLPFTPPPLPSGYAKHHLVVLEECHIPLPSFPFPHTCKGYFNTSPSEVSERIRDATLVITTIVPITRADLESAPHLQFVAIMATGMPSLDREAFVEHQIAVVNCPQSNIPAVSEHWLGLYFAARKKVVELHRATTETSEWIEKGTLVKRWGEAGPPLGVAGEVLGIYGHGALGDRIELLARSVGFGEILIAERKGIENKNVRMGRTGFDEVLERATCFVVTCPKDASTIDLIDEQELKKMRKETCLINMARGGIVNEVALAKALREGWISCAATDVLEHEPGGPGTSPLLPDLTRGETPVPNLTISPHCSWYSVRTIEMLHKLLLEGTVGFVEGKIPRRNVAVLEGKVYK